MHVPAEGMLPETFEGRRVHRAEVELVEEQVGVPGQTPGAGLSGAHHSSVARAPAFVALSLWHCTNAHDRQRHMKQNQSDLFQQKLKSAERKCHLSPCLPL